MASATDVITTTIAGVTFRCTRRTEAHLDWTIAELARIHPAARLRIIQPSYNDGVPQSAGTHDKDVVFDVEIVGLEWWVAQRFLRRCGWAAWVRFPPTFSWHIHMISLGYVGEVGIFVPGQVADYYAHALGLKGQHDSGSDTSWFPPDIAATVFDYDAWEADMPLSDDDLKKIDDIVKARVEAAFAKEQKNGKTLRENVLAIAAKVGVKAKP